MSTKEAERYAIFYRYSHKEITLKDVSIILQLSERQTKRLWKRFKEDSTRGLISRRRGKKNARAFSLKHEQKILEIIKEEYIDFGPTLISEKLLERNEIKASKEYIRQLMIKNRLWVSKVTRKKVYQLRERREREGEMVQVDGSHHVWFGNQVYVLLNGIDDASGKIWARFEEGETTVGYLRWMEEYIHKNGIPLSLYVDRYSTFKVNHGKNLQASTQFKRALDELGIKLIYARSPQAKGRVERAFRTLQDRLIKELKLNQITTIEQANAFLSQYIEDYNKRFGVKPKNSFNAHRTLEQNVDLKRILCIKECRKVSKNLEVQYEGEIYQLQAKHIKNRLQNSEVNIIKTLDEKVLIEHQDQLLNYKKINDAIYMPEILDTKELAAKWEKSVYRPKPAKNHPWKAA